MEAIEYNKPVPERDQDSTKFWEGCKRRKLLIQRCQDCKSYQFYPRLLCRKCMSENVEWVESSGKGEVYTFTIIHFHPNPNFKKDVPYVVAIVQLEEGIRIMSNVIGIEPNKVSIGMKVKVEFEDISETVALYRFKPVINQS